MNKNLIKKYKKEFDSWLDDENSVLVKLSDGAVWRNVISEDWGYLNNAKFVINDEYVEFRKALAEGKTVQYYVDGFTGWHDVSSVGNHCSASKNNYRIKPEEPQFKVGDWVRRKGYSNIFKVNAICNRFLHSSTSEHYLIKDMELWKPQQGEWIIPYDELYKDSFTVAQYDEEEHFLNCEPFIGQLPSFLKEIYE